MPTKYSKLETVRYIRTDTPDCAGIFLCAVPLGTDAVLTDDIVLQFDGNAWWHYGSGEIYRGAIVGIIGPIERLKQLKPKEDVFDV